MSNVKTIGAAASEIEAAIDANGQITLGTARYRSGLSTTVSTTAAVIYTPSSGHLTVVRVAGGDSATYSFYDEVAFDPSTGTAHPISQTTLAGSPPTRTYTVVGGALKVAIATGTATVKCAPIEFV